MLLPLSEIPTNVWPWASGAIVLMIFGIRSLMRSRTSNNILNSYFGWFGILVALAMSGYAFPAFFTTNPQILRWGLVLGNLSLTGGWLVQSRLLWFIGLRQKLSYQWVLIPTLMLASTSWVIEAATSQATITNHFLFYQYPASVGVITGSLVILLLIPLGFLFFYQSLGQPNFLTKFKSSLIGLIYLIMGASVFVNAALYHGVDTSETLLYNLIGFGLLVIVLLLPALAPPPTKGSRRSP
ncbi:hypothetical protein HY346_01395 [Candidatus Microgenomates bacterium]|nr:hypothetical protein [Candidatus Microgenomates bacterium]